MIDQQAIDAFEAFLVTSTKHPVESAKVFFADPVATVQNTDPLTVSLVSCAIVATYCFLGGWVTGNYSKVCASGCPEILAPALLSCINITEISCG
jgi:hypothetical protein